VAVDSGGRVPEDNYFHVLPGDEKRVLLAPSALGEGEGGGSIFVTALNLSTPVEVSR